MPERVDSTDPEGVDFGWVMQVTFVLTIVVGAPVVAVASTVVALPTWGAKAGFAVRVGALVWFVTAIAVYLYARRREDEGTDTTTASEPQD
jgi:membrane protein YdbS with pleckstrin-like domain